MMHFNKNQQIASIILTLISINNIEFITSSPSDCVTLSDKLHFQKIYSRKKRYVVFPPGSAVVAAGSLLKSLNPTPPGGINFLFESELFYPLQTTVAEWYPKEDAESKIDEDVAEYDSVPDSNNEQTEYWKQNEKWKENEYWKQNEYWKKNLKYWQQYTMHRERRDIMDHVERVASQNGIDIKSCLLRVICEANHYLLPQGQSFFQDVLRILFTTTYKDSVPDEYNHAMNVSEDDCNKVYGSQCRYSILGFLLENSK